MKKRLLDKFLGNFYLWLAVSFLLIALVYGIMFLEAHQSGIKGSPPISPKDHKFR